MAKVHKNYRLDAEVVDAVEAWARAHGKSNGEAVAVLLSRGLESGGEPAGGAEPSSVEGGHDDAALVDALRGNIEDLRGQVAALTEQVQSRDEQIRGLMEQATSLMSIASNAQALQGVAEQRLLEAARSANETDDAVVVAEDDTIAEAEHHDDGNVTETRGFRSWLARVFGI